MSSGKGADHRGGSGAHPRPVTGPGPRPATSPDGARRGWLGPGSTAPAGVGTRGPCAPDPQVTQDRAGDAVVAGAALDRSGRPGTGVVVRPDGSPEGVRPRA